MGCISSKLRAEDVVGRCKARKRLIKQAVEQRHAFAAAHAAYLVALRNTGAALRQFAEEEGGVPARGQGPFAGIPEPPPPPPLHFHDTTCTEPGFRRPSPDRSPPTETAKMEEEKEELTPAPATTADVLSTMEAIVDDSTDTMSQYSPGHITGNEASTMSTHLANGNTPERPEAPTAYLTDEQADIDTLEHELSLSMLRLSAKKDLPQIVREIDEEFLKASAGGADVSRTLETGLPQAVDLSKATRSYRVFNSFSWNRSRSHVNRIGKEDLQNAGGDDQKKASHALTLERLLAWEKKLVEEVKVVEALRAEQRKQCSILRRQETRAEGAADIDKTRAEVKRLHSLILVCNHAVDSTAEAIEDLRDDELHPQLVELISGLMNMWESMHRSHARQTQIIVHIKNIDAMMSQEPTSESHHQATIQLEKELLGWHDSFCKLVASQRGYMSALYGWIKLSLIPIPTGKAKKEYPTEGADYDDEDGRTEHEMETYRLCEEWHRALGCLPDRVASEAIKSLAEVVKAMVTKQGEEMKQKKKAEKLEKQWEKKVRALQPLVSEEEDDERTEEERRRRRRRRRREDEEEAAKDEDGLGGGVTMERKAAVAAIRKRVEGEMTKHCRAIQDTRVLTMNNLQTGVPGVLEAMTGFSAVCSHAFQHLNALTSC